jgi:three-Cys-motif partner protein
MSDALEKLRADDDELVCLAVRRWAEKKYRLVSLYAELFATGMKNKWDKRVYLDLYAGPGFGKIPGTSTVLKGSPMLALTVTHPFDKYIFCEENPQNMEALQIRAKRIAPDADIEYVLGDCHEQIDHILSLIPKHTPGNRVLSLCFVDPFDFGIKFDSLRKLSSLLMDFLVLLAIGMDANRNYDRYVEGESTKIDEALGNTEWRTRWAQPGVLRKEFRRFLATEFARSMESLRYLPQQLHQMKEVRSDEKNLPLYHLALFSRNELAYKFWRDVLKYGTDQESFF